MKLAVSQIASQTPLNLTIQPLYDTVSVATNQSAPLTYFTSPIGQSSKTLRDTNMRQAGGLPSPNEFYLRGFGLYVVPRSTQAVADVVDLQTLLDSAILSFYVGTNGRKLVEAHAALFPAGFGLDGMITTGGATSTNIAHVLGNGQRRLDNRYGLADYAEKLNASESFSAQLSFPDGALALTAAWEVRLYLPGIYGQSIG